jgi:hypothetical protein
MWCPAKVVRVADGESDKGMDGKPLSERAIKLAPRGMVLVEWEPDPEREEKVATTMWLLLDPHALASGMAMGNAHGASIPMSLQRSSSVRRTRGAQGSVRAHPDERG